MPQGQSLVLFSFLLLLTWSPLVSWLWVNYYADDFQIYVFSPESSQNVRLHTPIAYLTSLLKYQIGVTNWIRSKWAPDMDPFTPKTCYPHSLFYLYNGNSIFFSWLATNLEVIDLSGIIDLSFILITSTNPIGAAFKIYLEYNHSSLPLLLSH